MRRWRLLAGAVAAVSCGQTTYSTTGAGYSSGGYDGGGPSSTNPTPDGGVVMVAARRYAFGPTNLTLNAGATVVWRNIDTVPHTVTSGPPGSPDGKFDQGLQPGATFSYTFSTPGTFRYFCRIHYPMGMVGQVTVTSPTTP